MKKLSVNLFLTLFLLLGATNVMAQFQNGKVYRIVCSGTTSVSLGATALSDVAAVSTSETDKAQQWYVTVSGSNYTFRNLANGRYLQGNNTTSGAWGLTEESNNFTVSTVNNNYCIRGASHTNGYGYMHKDGSSNIVSWETSAANSQWTPIEVSYTSDQLQTIWNDVEKLVVPSATVTSYNTKLAAMFTDGACTKLNSTYAAKSLAQIKSDANYTALPAVLQAMVEKVYNEQVNKSTTAWTEANAVSSKKSWDNDYAKRFRVQMYEPYSIEGEITSYLRINAHSNMDNPTGIYANAGQAIYIMVDAEKIPDGAELWLAHQAGLGATGYYNGAAYTELHAGLNIVPNFNEAGTLWINYVVHTYDANGKTIAEKFPHKISDYAPLKIHIEGGYINGYYNAIGDFRAADSGTEDLWGEVDNDDDWNYYKVRAPLNGTDAVNRDFPLLGHRQTLLFPLGDHPNDAGNTEKGLLYHLDNITVLNAPNCYAGGASATYAAQYPGMGLDKDNGKINIMIEAWDRIMYSQLATMGVVSVSDMEKMNNLYPRWTSKGTPAEIYNYGNATVNGVTQTYQQFCQGIDYSEYFNHHGAGVGAGSGYMSGGWRVCNYHYETMGSIIGKISAEAGPTWGPGHEIGHQHQAVFNLNGQTEVTNNFFANVAVWYMGMGTSRYNGGEGSLESVLTAFNTEDNNLYSNNIWAITHLYYRLWLYYHLAGNNTQFWPRLFELCRQEPIINGGQISGETSLLRFYKHACNAAGEDLTEFFRAHGFFEVMDNVLIGDYSNGTYNVTQQQIDAAINDIKSKGYPVNYAALLINDGTKEATLKHDGKTSRALWDGSATAELGSVNDFIDGNVDALAGYTATVSADGTVTMTGGEGGIGFLVLNENGEIVSFSNKTTFELNDDAKYQLATGKTTVVAVNSDSETAEVEVDLTPMQRDLLGSFIADVEAMPIDFDGTYSRVGCYTKASATNLLAALANAKTILEAGNGGYAAAYEMLYAEREKLVNSDNATFVPFDPSMTYTITNYAYGTTMHLNSGVKVSESADKNANTAKWQFKTTSTDGVYNLYSLAGYYLPAAAKSVALSTVNGQSSAATYTLTATNRVGAWAITTPQTSTSGYGSLHAADGGKVVGWSSDADASKWYLTAIEGSNSNASSATDELQALIAKTESLMDVVGVAIPCTLQTTDAKAPFYLWCNANVTSGGDASMPERGYNILDGNDQTFLHTVFGSATSQDGLNHYLRLDMGEGNSLSQVQFSYKTRHNGDSKSHPKVIKVEGSNNLSAFEEIATISEGLPNEYSKVYTSGMLSNGKSYRYIRFMVTDTYGTATDGNGHEYFYIAEFCVPSLGDLYVNIDPEYDYVTKSALTAAYNAVVAAETAIEEGATDFTAVKSTLQSAYDKLYLEYNSPAVEKTAELQALINETKELVALVGTVTNNKEEAVALSTFNVYCNATIAEGELGNIFKDDNSFMHTQWSGKSADSDYHYLRVDMGEGKSIGEFYFVYTTASRTYQDMPKTIVVEGANKIDSDNSTKDAFTEIATLTAESDGLPQATGKNSEFESKVLGSASTPYRYLRFRITAIGRGTDTGDIADDNGYPYFTMAKFGLTKAACTTVTINDAYKNTKVTEELLIATDSKVVDAETLISNTASIELLDAQIATLSAAKDALEEAMGSKEDLKTVLYELLSEAQVLYVKIADENNGVIDDYYKSVITQSDFDRLITEISEAGPLVGNGATPTTSELETAINELGAICEKIDEIIADDFAENARTGMTELVAKMEALLGEVADRTETKTAIALQTMDAENSFYIWSNATAWDCDGIGALIDKNDDGTAKTGTFFGTTWDSGTTVNNYDHYIEIDLGGKVAISDLSFDYTTRNSTHANQRPTAIKVLGSTDKGAYTEIAEISERMPVGQNVKWEMSSAVALNCYYRYIRFAVAAEAGYFNMSDFNLYAHNAAEVNSNYSTSGITGEQMFAMNTALMAGIDARDKFVTEEQYNTVLAVLQAQYDELLRIKNANVNDKTSLTELIDATNTLIAEVATINEEETAIQLQATDANAPYYIYCNAPGTTNNYSGDNLGVSALLDVDDNGEPITATFLHTSYVNGSHDDELDHYLRVDMGETKALAAFKFRYTPRIGNTGNAPLVMLIEGSNDCVNFEEITTLSNMSTTYQSGEITNGKAYRYIRFMVKDTHNHSVHDGHKFFAMSHFEMTACKTVAIVEEYTSPNLSLSIVVDAYNETVDAGVIKNQYYVTQTVYDTALAELQTAYNALSVAESFKTIPVRITTDVNNPVLYKIEINRPGVPVLEYDGAESSSSMKVAVMDECPNHYQAWYFMQGTDDTSHDDIQIFPYYHNGAKNTTFRLGVEEVSNGPGKVVAVDGTDSKYKTNWYITFKTETKTDESGNKTEVNVTAEGWWNIQPVGMNNYFSNFGGVSEKMGFYNDASDGGSQFRFVMDETDYGLSVAYYALYNKHIACGGEKVAGNAIGHYKTEGIDTYNNLFGEAKEMLETANSTDEEYIAMLAELTAAFDALERNMPAEGKFYRLRSAYTGYSADALAYVGEQNDMYFSKDYDEASSRAIWQFELVDGGYRLKSLHTGDYVNNFGWATHVFLNESPGKITLEVIDEYNAILKIVAGHPMHAAAGGNIVGYSGGVNTASAWYIEELADDEIEEINYPYTLNAIGYGTLMLGFDAVVPDGVTAYYAENVVGVNIDMVEVGDILSANTPVILKSENTLADKLDLSFKYSSVAGTAVSGNMLGGTLYKKVVKCDSESVNNNVYVMQVKNGVVKMYWAYENFGADGKKVADENGSYNNDLGGYIMNSANRAYLVVPQNVAQQASMFNLRFNVGTTAVDDICEDDSASPVIHDLQGRRLKEVSTSGIYIVNGKKVYIK